MPNRQIDIPASFKSALSIKKIIKMTIKTDDEIIIFLFIELFL